MMPATMRRIAPSGVLPACGSSPVGSRSSAMASSTPRALQGAQQACRQLTHQAIAPSTTSPARHASQVPRIVPSASAAAGGAADAVPVEEGSSFTQAVFNVVNVMMGVGILTLPFALKSSGWVGIALLWLMGFICNYTGEAWE